MNIFAKNLKAFRLERNLTQAQLSEKTGINQVTISKWELDRSIPTMYNLMALADFFGCSIDFLTGRTED